MGYLKSFSKVKKPKRSKLKGTTVNHFDTSIGMLEGQVAEMERVILLMQAKYTTDMIPPIFNNYLFFRVVFKDILGLINQLQTEQSDLNKNLTIRSLALHLYEFLADTQDFLGPKMQGGLAGFTDLPDQELLVKDLYKLKEIYKTTKDKTFKELGDIRNHTTAHKEQNPLLLRSKIKNINYNNVQVHSILCLVLFLAIVHFQNNVCEALVKKMAIDKPEAVIPVSGKPYKTVERAFREIIMIIQGTDPGIAEIISGLTPEAIDKVKEIAAYLKQKQSAGQ